MKNKRTDITLVPLLVLILIVVVVFTLSISTPKSPETIGEKYVVVENMTTGVHENATSETNTSTNMTTNVTFVEITNLQLDKDKYGSHETVNLTTSVRSNVEGEFLIKVHGIAPLGYEHVKKEESITLHPGDNKIKTEFKTPRCTSGCGGVKPGDYNIFVEIQKGNETLANASTTITLVS